MTTTGAAVARIRDRRADRFFFGAAWLALPWLAWLLFQQARSGRPGTLAVALPLMALTVYVGLPRLHRLLSTIYVPGYFFGRSRTAAGLVGDPVNVAVDGTARQIHAAMTAACWDLADPVTVRTSWRIVVAAVFSRAYRTAPVSPLLLFDRPQCLAYQQQVGGSPTRRHHVRFWRVPADRPLPGGRKVGWLCDASFDRSTGLSAYTLRVTHHIAADIDAERDHVVRTVTAAHPGVEVEEFPDFSTAFHSRNGGGDPVYTDGTLPILDLSAVAPAPAQGLPEQVGRASFGYSDPLEPGEPAPPDADAPAAFAPPAPPVAGPPPAGWWYLLVSSAVLLPLQAWYAVRIALRGAPEELLGVHLDADQVRHLHAAVVAAMVPALVGALVLLVGTLIGRPRARTAFMGLLCVMFCVQEVERLVAHDRGSSWLAIMVIAVGVLALLFASGDDVARWTRKRDRDRLRARGSGAGSGNRAGFPQNR